MEQYISYIDYIFYIKATKKGFQPEKLKALYFNSHIQHLIP